MMYYLPGCEFRLYLKLIENEIVCRKRPGSGGEPDHMVLEVVGQPRKVATLQSLAGAKCATQGLSLSIVLKSLQKPEVNAGFAIPALEWVYFKLLKQIGLVDAEGNVLKLTDEMLRGSAFFSTEADVENFREVLQCGRILKFEEISELNRKFLVRFYRANGKCVLLAKQRADLGIPKKFPYKLDDLLDFTAPSKATSGNLKDGVKTLSFFEKTVAAKVETLKPAEERGRGLNGISGSISLDLPDGNETEDFDLSLNQLDEHVEIPILEGSNRSETSSIYQRTRRIFGATYIIILRIVSAIMVAGEYFHGTGGYIRTPNSDVNNEIRPAKRSRIVRYFIPTGSSAIGTCCKHCGPCYVVIFILMFLFGYVYAVVSHLGNGLFIEGDI
ncbi:unnamed protein product [Orchesella dallaii]|uniref:Uncharacterized protein n=1 Tax=Orchesella dallaii TaxID=48710 RepID=A0ABP1PU26_9HEXA